MRVRGVPRRTRRRGASFVEMLVLVGAIALAGIAMMSHLRGSMGAAAKREGECVASLDANCAQAGSAEAIKAPTSGPAPAPSPASGAPHCTSADGCGGSGGISDTCFAAGTIVTTESGFVAIEDVRAGMRVLAMAPDEGVTAWREVVRTFTRRAEVLERVRVARDDASDDDAESIVVTEEHPFLALDETWVSARELAPGMRLRSLAGATRVVSVETLALEASIPVYNMEVARTHTYAVGRLATVVHNECKKPAVTPGGPKDPRPTFDGPIDLSDTDGMKEKVRDMWIKLFQFNPRNVPLVDGTGKPDTLSDHNGDKGTTWNNADFYAIEVTLPPGVTREKFLFDMQQDVSALIGDARFDAEVTWPAAVSTPRPPGEVVPLVVRGRKAAPIAYVRTVDGKPGSADSFGVETVNLAGKSWFLERKLLPDNFHPVSGVRFWGVTPSATDPKKVVVWTAGRDALTAPMIGASPEFQDWTWRAMMRGVNASVRRNGGKGSNEFYSAVQAQPLRVAKNPEDSVRGPAEITTSNANSNPTQRVVSQTAQKAVEAAASAAAAAERARRLLRP